MTDFMISLCENYVAELGFKLVTPRYAVSCTTDCIMELSKQKSTLGIALVKALLSIQKY